VNNSKGSQRVIRGGSHSTIPMAVRSAYRDGEEPDKDDSTIGFRLVLEFDLTAPKHLDPKGYADWPLSTTNAKRKQKEASIKLGAPIEKTIRVNNISFEFILVPAGEYAMGSPEDEAERQGEEEYQHLIWITEPFYLGKYEVTQGQWKAIVGHQPSGFKGSPLLPVETVSWNDITKKFLPKMNLKNQNTNNFRLPTDFEWEYACRAGTETDFNWGSNHITTQQANYNAEPYNKGIKGENRQKTTKVGLFKSNAWGFYDMHGNVIEICQNLEPEYDYNRRREEVCSDRI